MYSTGPDVHLTMLKTIHLLYIRENENVIHLHFKNQSIYIIVQNKHTSKDEILQLNVFKCSLWVASFTLVHLKCIEVIGGILLCSKL